MKISYSPDTASPAADRMVRQPADDGYFWHHLEQWQDSALSFQHPPDAPVPDTASHHTPDNPSNPAPASVDLADPWQGGSRFPEDTPGIRTIPTAPPAPVTDIIQKQDDAPGIPVQGAPTTHPVSGTRSKKITPTTHQAPVPRTPNANPPPFHLYAEGREAELALRLPACRIHLLQPILQRLRQQFSDAGFRLRPVWINGEAP